MICAQVALMPGITGLSGSKSRCPKRSLVPDSLRVVRHVPADRRAGPRWRKSTGHPLDSLDLVAGHRQLERLRKVGKPDAQWPIRRPDRLHHQLAIPSWVTVRVANCLPVGIDIELHRDVVVALLFGCILVVSILACRARELQSKLKWHSMDAFQVVSEPRRREILRLVWNSDELSAGEIAGCFDVTFGAISQHLAVLRSGAIREGETRRQSTAGTRPTANASGRSRSHLSRCGARRSTAWRKPSKRTPEPPRRSGAGTDD